MLPGTGREPKAVYGVPGIPTAARSTRRVRPPRRAMLPYPAKIASHAQVKITVISALRPALDATLRFRMFMNYPG